MKTPRFPELPPAATADVEELAKRLDDACGRLTLAAQGCEKMARALEPPSPDIFAASMWTPSDPRGIALWAFARRIREIEAATWAARREVLDTMEPSI